MITNVYKIIVLLMCLVLVKVVDINTVGIEMIDAQSGKGIPWVKNAPRGQCLQSPHPSIDILKRIC
jgi:hypothetical protein